MAFLDESKSRPEQSIFRRVAGDKVIPNYTYRINLSNSIEDIKSNFDSKNRNVISKALKEEVVVTENSLKPEELLKFFKKSLLAAGANIYEDELKNIFLNFSDHSNSFSMIAKKGEEFFGAVFS